MWDSAKNIVTLARVSDGLDWPIFVAGPTSDPVAMGELTLMGDLAHSALLARMQHAAIFVSPALYEPFGLSVLEAASAGCALVLSDIPTFRELWGDAAVFVAPDDAAAARNAINRLIADRVLRASLAARARRRALTYAPEACTQATLEVYRRVLKKAARPDESEGDLLRAAG